MNIKSLADKGKNKSKNIAKKLLNKYIYIKKNTNHIHKKATYDQTKNTCFYVFFCYEIFFFPVVKILLSGIQK